MKKNVIFITIDSLNKGLLEYYGGGGHAPNMDSLLKERCIVFQNVITAANSTVLSHASIFTSSYPHEHGVLDAGTHLPSELPSLAGAFRDAGYLTIGVMSTQALSSIFGFDSGFNIFVNNSWFDRVTYFNSTHSLFGIKLIRVQHKLFQLLRVPKLSIRKARKTCEIARKLIKRHFSNPFFMWIHFIDPHEFITHEEYLERVADVDRQIGYLVEFLKKEDLWENTILAICSDHGETLDREKIKIRKVHSDAVTRDIIEVPFFICLPTGKEKREEIKPVVRTIDMAPTLCHIAGIKSPDCWKGMNLIEKSRSAELKDLPAITFGFPNKKDIISLLQNGWQYVFDYETSEESILPFTVNDEKKNNIDVSGEKERMLEWFRTELLKIKSSIRKGRKPDEKTKALTDHLLVELGYKKDV